MNDLFEYIPKDDGNDELFLWFSIIETFGKMSSRTKEFIENDSSALMDWRKDIKLTIGELIARIYKLASFYDISIDECIALYKSLEG